MSLRAVRLNATTYPVDPCEREELARAGAELVELDSPHDDPAAIASCDALLVISAYIPATLIDRLEKCRIIARYGVGTDRVDIEAATRAGIVVSNVPDFCVHEQADHTLALLLAFARRLPFMFAAMRRGAWSARDNPEVHRIHGQTLGLIGFGASATAVAQRAAPFGLRLLGWARNAARHQEKAKAHGVQLVEIDALLRESDFVSLHLPLTGETRHFLSAERLALMKPTAVLINTSRGAVVDEAALIEALRSRRIGGAALDVFETLDVFAPPLAPGQSLSHPLLDLENLIATPHCAGSSVESALDSKRRGARHAAEVLQGHWPQHVVNPQVVPRGGATLLRR